MYETVNDELEAQRKKNQQIESEYNSQKKKAEEFLA